MKAIFSVFFIQIVIGLFILGCWIGNLVQFTKCDFKEPYKSEIIHGVGVFTVVASVVTVWFPVDNEQEKEQIEK